MKNGKHEVIAQIAGPGLVLAALVAMVLSNPRVRHAQSKLTPGWGTPQRQPILLCLLNP